jgi:hypothetical protein
METSSPHVYGTMQSAPGFGMVIVGGTNSGSSTEISVDGTEWVGGKSF